MRWGVAGNIVIAWIFTMPGAGLVAAVAYVVSDLPHRLDRPQTATTGDGPATGTSACRHCRTSSGPPAVARGQPKRPEM